MTSAAKTTPNKAMATSNYISAELTAEQETAAMAAIAGLETQLGFLVDLDPAVLRRIARAGDRSQAFVERALNLAAESPEILPGEFDLAEFRRDVALAAALGRLSGALTRVQERVKTSITAAKADAFAQALEVYNRSKRTKRAGFDTLTRELGQRFRPRPGSPADDPNGATPAPTA
jgi:hypothetical protein